MDIEYAKNCGPEGSSVMEARAGVGASCRAAAVPRAMVTKAPAPVLASGRAVGGKSVTGIARFVSSAKDLDAFRSGEILMAEFTLPEWQSVMQRAAAIVTNRGGRGCHAAIAARKLGVPAVVGTIDGASRLWTGATLTVSCANGGIGRVYEGVPSQISSSDAKRSPKTKPIRREAARAGG